jgi:site-specific DNA-methyltransferase (adenine-specific)
MLNAHMVELNKLYFDNCKNILQQVDDGIIDFVLQDPPFEVTSNEWDTGFIKTLPEMWELWRLKSKPNACYAFKATYPFAIDLINSNRKMFKYEWIWKKNNVTNVLQAKRMPMRCIEYIFIFYKDQPIYNPIQRKILHPKEEKYRARMGGTTYNITENLNYKKEKTEYGNPVNLIDISHEKEAFNSSHGSQDRHPNRTNPELWEYFIKTYTNENDLVFDGYSGSGSIPQACIRTNRNFIACENNEKEFLKAEKTIRDEKEILLHGYPKSKFTEDDLSLFSKAS